MIYQQPLITVQGHLNQDHLNYKIVHSIAVSIKEIKQAMQIPYGMLQLNT